MEGFEGVTDSTASSSVLETFSSDANWVVNELDRIAGIDPKDYKHFKKKGLELESYLLKTMEKEAGITEQGKQLNKEFLEEKRKIKELEKLKLENTQYIADLKKDLMKAENQTALMNESEAVTQTSVIELERKIAILDDQKRELIEQQNAKERPIVENCKNNIKQLKQGIKEIEERKKKEEEKKIKLEQDIAASKYDLDNTLKTQGRDLEKTLQRLKEEPERERRQTEIVRKASKASYDEVRSLVDRLDLLDREINEIETKKIDFEQIHYNMFMLEDSAKIGASKLQEDIDRMRQTLLLEKDHGKEEMLERVRLNLLLKTTAEEENTEIKHKQSLENEENMYSRDAYNAQLQLEHTKSAIDKLTKMVEELSSEKQMLQSELETTKEKKIEIERDVDLLIHELLTGEAEYMFLAQKLKTRNLETDELENKIAVVDDQEGEMNKVISNLEAARERKAREAAKKKRDFMEAVGEIKICHFSNGELYKNLTEIENKYIALQQSYSLMERERNKYAKAIQDSAQSHAEIREKNKILENELEVLTKQNQQKSEELKQVKRKVEDEVTTKASMLSEFSKKRLASKQKEEQNLELIMEIDKLNADINLAEEIMALLKKKYEGGVQDRNYTGIQLIDRNDELCILYEKANAQEKIIKEGEIEMRKRDEEIKGLKLDLEEEKRKLEVLFKNLPEYESLLKVEEDLKVDIEKLNTQGQKLSEELERPENLERWRKLPGTDSVNEEELQDKIQDLEEKLNQRREQLMEKNLVLKGITKSSDKLRKLAMKGRDESFDLSVNLNFIQKKIEQTTNKMKSTVSELSIYGTETMRLEAENKQIKSMVDEARDRMSRGEPPTEEIEREWAHEEEVKQRWKEQMADRKKRLEFESSLPSTITRTTAIKRPNAYIPDDELGIPKPYFMPPVIYSTNSANMRHIKKPKAKDIVI
ncbi:hypothetical protein NAEGRDRAFT_62959 [Naegleria gruberi]|uniref:Uncharacterized protein n=1 Tax=Naegleria gruberi TaxID=5762 RepID=D2V2C8_NAEGR|nr:uncharacterized protein NAEGRDRAFT_62959 [Naegleria gruberi]EFC49035.1 hypothetical protein NAEGRDRAFT_62959 [Naegleria gruberi]|eukprot:XP_002681779.1 hypothetical protein NAEGRDRAFT_62959 [Naegleria gruberi strain NEG-M]